VNDLFGDDPLIAHEDVGRSDRRTPAKLDVLRAHAGRMIGASWYAAKKTGWKISGNHVIDLTAGDAAGDGEHEWIQGSSPAVLSSFCRTQINLRVTLIERSKPIFARLNENMSRCLPRYGFVEIGSMNWRHNVTGSTINMICTDARTVDLTDLLPDEWLYVFNDPNSMHGWCLDVKLLGFLSKSRPVSFMSTMGCNTDGLKRLILDERLGWLAHINAAIEMVKLNPHLDLLLFDIKNDPAQWAYLLLVPRKWVEETRAQMVRAFTQSELVVGSLSWRKNQTEFYETVDKLIYTNKERAERTRQ
jgi:hypothetical protein